MNEVLSHILAFVGGVLATIVGGYFTQRLIDRRRKKEQSRSKESRFESTAELMPDIIRQIRKELAKDENNLVQELVVSPHEKIRLPGDKRRIYCYESKHENLHEKLDRLVLEGYVQDISSGNARILRMSGEFLRHIQSV